MTALVREIDSDDPEGTLIDQAADVLRSGGLVVFPTTGLYGLAADARDPEAIRKVFAAKGRPEAKALSVLIDTPERLDSITASVPPNARILMERFWPGRLTIVFPAAAGLPVELTAGTGTIAVRLPAHPVARALTKAFGGPVTATSANLSGEPGVFRISDLPPELTERVDLVLDGGKLRGGAGSTIVDATKDPPVVLREGAVLTSELSAAFRKQLR